MNSKPIITRTKFLNSMINTFEYSSYLEIGVSNPKQNFDFIFVKHKVGVDPNPVRQDIISQTSDEYFLRLPPEQKFDLIFIDGLHYHEQVLKDIENSLKHLNEKGFIVCHDMLPDNEEMQLVPRQVFSWTGDCWKAWAQLRMTRGDLDMFVVDADHGLGVISRGHQELYPFKDFSLLNYDFFVSNKKFLMNILEVEDVFMDL